MTTLQPVWTWATTNRRTAVSLAAAVVGLGVLIIAVGGWQHWGWTRLIGASLISLGAVLAGLLLGWRDPLRPRLAAVLRRWRASLVVVLALIMTGPVLATLLFSVGGLGTSDADLALAVLGALVLLLLLLVTGGAVVLALKLALDGLRQSDGPAEDAPASPNGRETP